MFLNFKQDLSFIDASGNEIKVGDVIKDGDHENYRHILLFGAFDNGCCYECAESGIGFFFVEISNYHLPEENPENLWKYVDVTGAQPTASYELEKDPKILKSISEDKQRFMADAQSAIFFAVTGHTYHEPD